MDIDNLIGKILQNEATEAEQVIFEEWLNESENNRKAFEAMKTYWNASVQTNEMREQRRWEMTLGKIYEIDNGGESSEKYLKNEKAPRKKTFYQILPWYFQVAAVVLLLGLCLTWLFRQQPSLERSSDVEKLAYVEKTSENGVKKTIKLTDGTTIKLNSGSTIKFPDAFTENKREVYLIGEAYFDVARDEQRPFIIHTEKLDVTVLGTSFNVNAYEKQTNPSVAVVEGKVKVATSPSSEENALAVILEKGEMASVESGLKTEPLNENAIAWTENLLLFDTDDFVEITQELEKWYGVEVRIDKMPQMGKGFKGRFKNESLKNVLESMQYTLGIHFDYQQTKQLVVIY